MDNYPSVVLGGGCFWCMEAMFQRMKGILSIEPGYSGGQIPNPTYEQVYTDQTGHVEVIRVSFDPEALDYETLFEAFFESHDPTQADGQGEDIGTRYLSRIFYQNEEEREAAEAALNRAQSGLSSPVVTKILKLSAFYPAEAYHRDYFNAHPENPYCSLVVAKKVKAFTEKLEKAGRLKF